MIAKKDLNVLIDAREFVSEKLTGIGRVLEVLTDALAESDTIKEVILTVSSPDVVPDRLRNRKKIQIQIISKSFLKSEKTLSDLSRTGIKFFISPYPKLPLFDCHCKSVHIIHDVLDLTHPLYRKRFKVLFDGWRLKRALKKADLTWYDSSWTMEETKKYAGYTGKNPKVRYPGIDERFNIKNDENQNEVLSKYDLQAGYILIIGNGLPHKNLGVILKIANQLSRKIVFAGVSPRNQNYWYKRYPELKATWINHVTDDDLPFLIKGSFCLAQPSTVEGYGYPPLEAMACGIPAVVSNIPVLAETTGGNALVADPADHRTWIEAFEALENKDIYENQIGKGLQWVEPLQGRKGWQKHIADIEKLLSNQGIVKKYVN